MARTAPEAARDPAELAQLAPAWLPARVPGTAWQALLDAGADPLHPAPLHDEDVWFRVALEGEGTRLLDCAGLAGLAELWLDDTAVATSDTMFVPCRAALTLAGRHTLTIRFRALNRALALVRGRQRWRTLLTDKPGLRRHRQTMLGHMPGWCPPVAAIGPYRPIHLHDPACPVIELRLQASLAGTEGRLAVDLAAVAGLGDATPIALTVAGHTAPLVPAAGAGRRTAELRLPGIAPWWPHTHGDPVLHDATLHIGAASLTLAPIGFRRVHVDHGADGQAFTLHVNGVPVFCRGACWTNASLADLAGTDAAYRPALTQARDAGMNMIRVPGLMTYEAPAFHALCNALGLLVWQEFMFANLDVPDGDPALAPLIAAEAEALLDPLGASPSLAVLCGGSEVAQQGVFMSVPASHRTLPLFEHTLAELAAAHAPGVPYLPNTPWGGEPPTRNDTGVGHYYGVGAYLRPLDDARRARVRFAAECLAFSNVPDELASRSLPVAVHHPDWKRGVPRDPGASWDFEDIRNHYIALLYDVDHRLRRTDPERYLALSRATGADLMEAVIAEWRRPGSTTAGALVWQLQDLRPGAGWGLLDDRARPKPACHGFARVAAPIQVLISDEGLDGLAIHVLNERPEPLEAEVVLRCLHHGRIVAAEGRAPVALAGRSATTLTCHDLLGRYFDTTRAHRFSAPTHEVCHVRLQRDGAILSEAFHFPEGRTLPAAELGLTATPEDGALVVATERFAQSVHIVCEEGEATPNWFHLAPGAPRRVAVTGTHGVVRALNAERATAFKM